MSGIETPAKLPREVEHELYGYSESYRTNPEKRFALALLIGGVTELKLSETYWIEKPADRSGCLITTNSIEATGGTRVGTDHLLWAVLHRLGIGFSGGGSSEKNWAQASWNKESVKTCSIPYGQLDLPMVVHYFNVLKNMD